MATSRRAGGSCSIARSPSRIVPSADVLEAGDHAQGAGLAAARRAQQARRSRRRRSPGRHGRPPGPAPSAAAGRSWSPGRGRGSPCCLRQAASGAMRAPLSRSKRWARSLAIWPRPAGGRGRSGPPRPRGRWRAAPGRSGAQQEHGAHVQRRHGVELQGEGAGHRLRCHLDILRPHAQEAVAARRPSASPRASGSAALQHVGRHPLAACSGRQG